LTTPERDEAALKTFLGKRTYDDLIAALENITAEDLFRDKYLGKYSKSYREYASSTLEQLSKPTLVDLFCGSGGLSLGLIQSGFRVVFANDIEKAALQTYSFNHPEIEGRNITMGGIESIASNIDEYVSEAVDVIAGGPPCQGFSEANRQRLID
ncbi:DNA cytosine methyltransferase, partial [Mordavella massiliensis]|uniref:DNA cytosine methyltransferase n=2 Tax=Bacillota TaxID=1239 RepID=UPI002108A679|nr:DNA cytosine methyltransferase [Mordavella massiliensis]